MPTDLEQSALLDEILSDRISGKNSGEGTSEGGDCVQRVI
jgi:hypothetical protein